jgi:large subunit ribosomal protein L19
MTEEKKETEKKETPKKKIGQKVAEDRKVEKELGEKELEPTKKKDRPVKAKKKIRKLPEIRSGYLVKVVHLSPDGKQDLTTEGTVIRVRGAGENKTFTVRRIAEGVGVEKVFSFASPALKKLTVIKKDQARRSRLYYLRSKK